MEDCYSPKKKKPRNAYFLGCFGFSFSLPVDNQELEISPSGHKVKAAGGKKRKQSSCFSFKGKQSAARTVPVDNAADIAAVKGGYEELKKGSVKRRQPLTEKVSVTGQTKHSDKSNKSKYRKQVVEHNKSLDYSQQSNCHPNSSGASPPPKDKHEIITRAVSLPPAPQKRSKEGVLTTSAQPASAKLVNQVKDSNDNNMDSVIGMSILMVTLMIMVFWGKLCAIMCTCAWFYFLPKIRAKNEAVINGEKKKIDDVNSVEYKKKVVLNGFLERNHRNGIAL